MLKTNIETKLSTKKKGQFIRLTYLTDLTDKMRASSKLIYAVEKITTGTFKYGCDLRKVKRYIEREAARTTPKKEVAEWSRWITPNVFKENIKTGRIYLHLITVPNNSNSHTQYYLVDRSTGERRPVTKEELQTKDIMQPSYWNKVSTEVMAIALDNIIDIK